MKLAPEVQVIWYTNGGRRARQILFTLEGEREFFFCIAKQCTVAHQGNFKKVPIFSIEVHILQDKSTAFCKPMLNLCLMKDELAKELVSNTETLEVWAEFKNLSEITSLQGEEEVTRKNKVSV